ncbi:PleD family two-component system response regulator [Bradyrhizobium sp. 1.29L]
MSTERRAPMVLAIAARPYLDRLSKVLDQSEVCLVAAEFERSVFAAADSQPDLILVASPPIGDALNTCQRLRENRSTRYIPIFLISLNYNVIDDTSSIHQATAGASPCRNKSDKRVIAAEDAPSLVGRKEKKQLEGILHLLRYVEAEIIQLHLETSAVLLGASIADLAQNLE